MKRVVATKAKPLERPVLRVAVIRSGSKIYTTNEPFQDSLVFTAGTGVELHLHLK
ncbi:hypothetical protein ACFLXP_04345 [Chloroflexota bacterium]